MASADAWLRLGTALLISAMLHAVLVYGVALPAPSLGPMAPTLSARLVELEPSAERVPQAAARVRPLQPASHPPTEPPLLASEPAPAPPVQPLGVSAALPAVAVPLIEDTTWYSALQLDVYPRTLVPVQPEYPSHLLSQRQMGEISLAVKIGAVGQIQEVRVVEANPPGYFEEAAVAAVNAARFAPAQKDGRNVRSEIIVRLVYDPDAQPSAARPVTVSEPEAR